MFRWLLAFRLHLTTPVVSCRADSAHVFLFLLLASRFSDTVPWIFIMFALNIHYICLWHAYCWPLHLVLAVQFLRRFNLVSLMLCQFSLSMFYSSFKVFLLHTVTHISFMYCVLRILFWFPCRLVCVGSLVLVILSSLCV